VPTVLDVLGELEQLAPLRFAFAFDKIGLQIGDPASRVTKAVVSLDRSLAAAEYAATQNAQLLLSHHPLIWEPMAAITANSHAGRTAMSLIKNGISFIAAHTNWDAAEGGINDTLCSILGLQDVRVFGDAAESKNLKLVVLAPPEAADCIIDAASSAGAGKIGHYRRCSFTTPGKGTFHGDETTTPAVGKAERMESVDEVRIEMVLPAGLRDRVDRAVRKVHPYEVPVCDFFQLAGEGEQPIARLGTLEKPMTLRDFTHFVNNKLSTVSWTWGDPDRAVRTVAVCGGAADEEWRQARDAGADVLLTGEVKQHVGLEASESGFALTAAGHYATEQPGCVALRDHMAKRMGDIEWLIFEPEPGFAGRPF
jgi:dinuclear metal center YbgI/SA1388 family protein